MQRKELVKTLELVGRALANDDLVPIFQCYMFNGQEVVAYNDELAITAECKTGESFAVNGKVLLGLLNASSGEEVDLTLKKGALVVKTGASIFSLPYQSKDHHIYLDTGKFHTIFGIDENFIKGLEACLMTTSSSDDQRAFKGVLLSQKDKNITLYSTNGDAISRYRTAQPSIIKVNYMLPNSFCEAVVRMAKELGITEGDIGLNEDWAEVVLGDFTISGRMIILDQPIDHEAEIRKTQNEVTLSPIPEGLNAALSRARVITDIESSPTTIDVINGAMLLVTESNALGVVEDELTFDHPDVEAKVSAELLQRCVGMTQMMAVYPHCCCFQQSAAPTALFIITSNFQ